VAQEPGDPAVGTSYGARETRCAHLTRVVGKSGPRVSFAILWVLAVAGAVGFGLSLKAHLDLQESVVPLVRKTLVDLPENLAMLNASVPVDVVGGSFRNDVELVVLYEGQVQLARLPLFDGINCWETTDDRACTPEQDLNGDGRCDGLDCVVRGLPGAPGTNGVTGPPGPRGCACWDLNCNGLCDTEPNEGSCTPAECQGAPGEAGTDGADGTDGTNGTDGAAGPQGPTGDAGSADGPLCSNVSSSTFTSCYEPDGTGKRWHWRGLYAGPDGGTGTSTSRARNFVTVWPTGDMCVGCGMTPWSNYFSTNVRGAKLSVHGRLGLGGTTPIFAVSSGNGLGEARFDVTDNAGVVLSRKVVTGGTGFYDSFMRMALLSTTQGQPGPPGSNRTISLIRVGPDYEVYAPWGRLEVQEVPFWTAVPQGVRSLGLAANHTHLFADNDAGSITLAVGGRVGINIAKNTGGNLLNVCVGTTNCTSAAFHVQGDAFKTEGGASWSGPSDLRVKTAVAPADLARMYSDWSRLELVRFTWDPRYYPDVEDRTVTGYIAQSVEKVVPKAVKRRKMCFDLPEGGTECIPDFRVLNQGQLDLLADGALRVVDSRVARLAGLVEALLLRVGDLERQVDQLNIIA